jgi:hypothetical protein
MGKLRAIDQGTRYDVAGRLMQMARQIKHGEMGDVRNVVIAVQRISKDGGIGISTFHFGPGDIPTAVYIWESAKNEMV